MKGLVAIALSALILTPAVAQGTDEEEVVDGAGESSSDDESKQLVEKAIAAVLEKDFQLAVRLFRRAYFLDGKASTLFNLAAAHRKAGNFVEAAENFEEFLEAPGELDDRYIKDARKQIRELDSKLLRVQVKAERGDVFVNGIKVERNKRPLLLHLEPREHTIMYKRGAVERQRTIEGDAGDSLIVSFLATGVGKLPLHVRGDWAPSTSELRAIIAVGAGYRIRNFEPYVSLLLGGAISTDTKYGAEVGLRAYYGGKLGGFVDLAGHALFSDGFNPGFRAQVGGYYRFGPAEFHLGAGISMLTKTDDTVLVVPAGLLFRF